MSSSASPAMLCSSFTPMQVKLVDVSMVALTMVIVVMTLQQPTVTMVMEQSLGSNKELSVVFVVFSVAFVSIGASPSMSLGASPIVSVES